MADTKLAKVGITVKESWKGDISYEVLDYTLWRAQDGGDGCGYIAKRANIGVRPDSDDSVWIKATQAGQSIYDLAVKYGHFAGTEEEFEAEYQAALQAARDAASETSATNTEIQEAEELRKTAENSRVEAETARQTAESARRTAETARETAESGRQTAEAQRSENETNRQSQETARQNAEQARRSNETARENAEQERTADFEGLKTDMQTAIQQADAAAAAADALNNQVAGDESARQTAESGRVAAETQRQTAETQRGTNEQTMQTQETARQAAEQTRNTQEGTRQTQEEARQTAEQGRASAESQRVSNETARLQAETAREEQSTSDHQRAEDDHAQAQDDHEVMAGYDTRLTNAETEVSQLEAKVDDIVVKPEWLEGYEDANLFHTRACELAEQGAYVYVYGGTIAFPASASYNTYLLTVDPTKKYKFKNIRFGVPVKADKTTPCSNTVIENETLVDMSNYTDVAYIYFSFNTGDYNPANYIVSEGETLSEEITLPAWFGDWVNEFVEPQGIPDGSVTTQKIATDAVSTAKIQDNAVTIDKVAFKDKASNNLINKNDSDVMLGYYQAGATPSVNSSYNLTGYIPVIAGETYVYSKDGEDSQGMRFLCYFDSSKNYVSDVSTTGVYGPFVIPSGVAYVRVSIYTTAWDKSQLEKGSTITPYKDYDPTIAIKKQYIPKITRDMVDDSSGFPSSPIPFASFRDSFEVASNETKQVDGIFSAKSLYLSAEIVGTIEEVIIGVGSGSMYGSGVKITPTQMFLVSGSSLTVDNTYSHGLTLGTMTKVVIHREQNDLIYVDLYDDAGNTFRGGNRNAYIGMPFVINNGATAVNISVSQFNRDANTPILVCGDSYWSMADSRRITDNLLNYGCKGFQLYARGGIDAAGIYPSLERTIEQGAKPKYIIWDIGMNGGADSDGAVNTSWLSYTTQFLALCDNAGITPVLCTIPSVPSQIHTKLNEWVRASGRRYIDLDSEVKAISGYYWRGWGTADALLSSDEVHPTTAGAKQLALRIMVDFPEIAVL